MGVKLSLANIFVSLITFTKPFLLDKTFLHFFFAYKSHICLSALPNLRKASMPWCFTRMSISANNAITDSSNVSSEAESEIPLIIMLFQRPYCAKVL